MTHYVENVGKDDVIFIEVLQADHFSGMFASSLMTSKILTRDRYLCRAMGWPYPSADRDGYAEFDKFDRLAIQEGEAVHRPR